MFIPWNFDARLFHVFGNLQFSRFSMTFTLMYTNMNIVSSLRMHIFKRSTNARTKLMRTTGSILGCAQNLLCIHKRSLVTLAGARDPKRALGRSQALERALFGSLALARLLCMHKRSLVFRRFFCVNAINVSM